MQKRRRTEFSVLPFSLRFTHCNPFSPTVSQDASRFSRSLVTPSCLPIFSVSLQPFCKTDKHLCCHVQGSSSRNPAEEQALKQRACFLERLGPVQHWRDQYGKNSTRVLMETSKLVAWILHEYIMSNQSNFSLWQNDEPCGDVKP